jgi:hypothetical protein
MNFNYQFRFIYSDIFKFDGTVVLCQERVFSL